MKFSSETLMIQIRSYLRKKLNLISTTSHLYGHFSERLDYVDSITTSKTNCFPVKLSSVFLVYSSENSINQTKLLFRKKHESKYSDEYYLSTILGFFDSHGFDARIKQVSLIRFFSTILNFSVQIYCEIFQMRNFFSRDNPMLQETCQLFGISRLRCRDRNEFFYPFISSKPLKFLLMDR